MYRYEPSRFLSYILVNGSAELSVKKKQIRFQWSWLMQTQAQTGIFAHIFLRFGDHLTFFLHLSFFHTIGTFIHTFILENRRKIRLIEGNAKCRHLKTVTCKETLRQVFIRVCTLEKKIANFLRTFSHVGIFNRAYPQNRINEHFFKT